MRWLLFSLALLLPIVESKAAYLKAEELKHDCTAVVGDRTANLDRCMWYIGAIHDAMQDAGSFGGMKACFPRDVVLGDLVRPVLLFMEKLPRGKSFGAGGVVTLALASAYPCP
ncbi:hypothetical protein ABH994_007485 [Bradyrhizobium yuanmingense]|uniref:Rap1a/Tai family immunity protein n=1 Tax=Bradyrhizobium yuanmingense TaxID=108015 RepID=UPI00351852FC